MEKNRRFRLIQDRRSGCCLGDDSHPAVFPILKPARAFPHAPRTIHRRLRPLASKERQFSLAIFPVSHPRVFPIDMSQSKKMALGCALEKSVNAKNVTGPVMSGGGRALRRAPCVPHRPSWTPSASSRHPHRARRPSRGPEVPDRCRPADRKPPFRRRPRTDCTCSWSQPDDFAGFSPAPRSLPGAAGRPRSLYGERMEVQTRLDPPNPENRRSSPTPHPRSLGGPRA